MLFGFLSRTTTYPKATEKAEIKRTKNTFINVSVDCTFLIVNKNVLINLK